MTEPDSHRIPILVTGAHRTGTTWVGKLLTASGEAAYISEPLNVLHRPGVLRIPTKFWYPYICGENQSGYLPYLRETLALHYHAWAELRSLRSHKDLLRMGRDGYAFLRGRLLHQRPLLKDPFAVFSTPWFAQALGCQVVVIIRHPAAFASSLKRLGWSFNFTDLLAQPLLMRDWLEPFREEMIATASDDIIGQASLLWRMIYQVVNYQQQEHPQFQVVTHEELSLVPLQGFRNLYTSLGLQYSSRVERAILSSSGSDNPEELSRSKVHATRLDSRANLQNWRRRLSQAEIERIHQLTWDVARLYYPEITWE